MQNIHGNLVGITKKDIYIITNKANGKSYVGQAKNTTERFKTHCKKSAIKDNSLIDKAIQKYGKDNFEVRVLEHQTENYNERETFWINCLDTKVPNGYNIIAIGGSPPCYRGTDSCKAKCSLETLQEIIFLLKNTQLTLQEIAQTVNVSKSIINTINQGRTYILPQETYLLRKTPNSSYKLTQQQAIKIQQRLLTTWDKYEKIAKDYQVNISLLKKINLGTSYRSDNLDYPLRKFKNSGKDSLSQETVKKIIDLIKKTDLSLRKIAKLIEVNHHTVIMINNGASKKYRLPSESYPIRKPF